MIGVPKEFDLLITFIKSFPSNSKIEGDETEDTLRFYFLLGPSLDLLL
jgi:hypothetical protein